MILPLTPMPPTFGFNLRASTNGSVEDLSLTGSCMSVRSTVSKYMQSEHYMPGILPMAGVIKSFKKWQISLS